MAEKYFEKNYLVHISGNADKLTLEALDNDIVIAADYVVSNADIVNPHLKVSEIIQQDSIIYEEFNEL